MPKDSQRVIALMRETFPAIADYNVINDGKNWTYYAELLDGSGRRIMVISADELDNYWNRMEREKRIKGGGQCRK